MPIIEEDGIPEIGIQHNIVHLVVGPEECGICFTNLSSKRQIRLKPCGHSFHRSCAVSWRETHILFDGREEGRMQCITCRQSCDDMWDDLGWITTWTSHGPSGHPDVMIFVYYLCTKDTWFLHLHLESLKIITEWRVTKLIKEKTSTENDGIGEVFINDIENEIKKLNIRIALLQLLLRDFTRLKEDISNGVTRSSLLTVVDEDSAPTFLEQQRAISPALAARDPPDPTGARGETIPDPVSIPPAAIKAAAAICLYAGFAATLASSLPADKDMNGGSAAFAPSVAATPDEAAIAELLHPSFADNVATLRVAADDAGRAVDAGIVITAAAVFRSAALQASTTADPADDNSALTSSEGEDSFKETEPSCLYCRTALSLKRSVTVSPCGHVVHRSCLMRRIDEAMECSSETDSLPTCSCGAIAKSFSHPHAIERVGYWGMHENQKRLYEKDRSKEERLILSHRRIHCRHILLILAEQRRQALRNCNSAGYIREIEEERVKVTKTYHSIIHRLLELCEAACKKDDVRPLYIERFSIPPPLQKLTIKQRWEHARMPLIAKSIDIED